MARRRRGQAGGGRRVRRLVRRTLGALLALALVAALALVPEARALVAQAAATAAEALGDLAGQALDAASGAVAELSGASSDASADDADADGSSARLSTPTTWDAEESPDYYRIVGTAVVDVELEAGEVVYEGLDELGRTGRVVACVTYDMMVEGMARERADMSDLEPSGWGHNAEVTIQNPDGSTYHGYLYNRSHLLAKSLGGADVVENLVCGTRTQNVGDNTGSDGGMAYAETLAREWLEANPEGTVWYSATPLYVGDELLCRSVVVDVWSSDGTLDLEIEVYNAAAGYVIDYATGEWSEE